MGLTEKRFKTLRAKLDEHGYRQPLALESLLLVEQIFSDLIHTKEDLDHFKGIVHQNQERYGGNRLGIESLKDENEKLFYECNRLRSALREEQETKEKLFKDLKLRVRVLERNNSDLEFVCSQHLERISELSVQLAEKGQKILSLKGLGKPTYNKLSVPKTHPRKAASAPSVGTRFERRSPTKSTSAATDVTNQPLLHPSSVLSSIPDVCSTSKKKIDSLLKELVTLKQEKLSYLEEIAAVQSKVAVRNQEIERLQHMLEVAHNTPMPVVGKCPSNCCKERCFCTNNNGSYMESQLREQLLESQELQHEAMCRAVKLAERNAQLEEQLMKSRMGGICKCVSDDQNTIRKLQEKLDCKMLQIEELESKLKVLENAKKGPNDNGEGECGERNDNRILEERIRELTMIENDLVTEIERLTEVNTRQHDLLQHLESKLSLTENKPAEQEENDQSRERTCENGKNENQEQVLESMNDKSTYVRMKKKDPTKTPNGSVHDCTSNLHETNNQNASPIRKSPAKKGMNKPLDVSNPKPRALKNNPANQSKQNSSPNPSPRKYNTEKDKKELFKGKGKKKNQPSSQVPNQSCHEEDTKDKSDARNNNDRAIQTGMMTSQVEVRSFATTMNCACFSSKTREENHEASGRSSLQQKPAAKKSSSNFGPNFPDGVPASKQDRFASSKAKKTSSSSSVRSDKVETKEKAIEEEKLKRERILLDEERKRLEETIRNLTDKQTELINKLHEAYSGTSMGSSEQPDRDLVIKLERLQAERDNYQKELSKIRDQINNLVDDDAAATEGGRNQSPSCILQHLVTERDFYQKEFNRLQQQMSSVNTNISNRDQSEVVEMRAKLNEKEREICCLKEQIRDLCAKQQLARRSPSPNQLPNSLIVRLEMERDTAKADYARMAEDRNALREQLRNITEMNKAEIHRLEHGSHALQTTITKLEVERRELANTLCATKAKVGMLEKKLEEYRSHMQKQQTDCSQQIAHLNHIKMLHEQTDRALGSSQDMLTQTETELASALERIHDLEQKVMCLERELCCMRTARMSLRTSISQIDEDKDKLLLKVDEKTEQLVKLERECHAKENRIAHLESVIADMQRKLDSALDTANESEMTTRQSCLELEQMKQGMMSLEHARDSAILENKRLLNDLAAMTHDQGKLCRCLEMSKREVEDLKMQLQGYVTEVRHVEELLEKKDKERSDMLDHFKSLSQEANALESCNNTLENEARSSKSLLRAAEEEIYDLKHQLEDKDALVCGYEKQISELTSQIACLEMKLSKINEQKQILEKEMKTLKEQCCKLDQQKQELSRQCSDQESNKKKTESEYYRMQAKHDCIEEELQKERRNSATLESTLAAARQETHEKKVSNTELRQQVENLQVKVCELQKKLEHGNDALRQCQVDSADYQQQLVDLRRECTNSQFQQACADERSAAAKNELQKLQSQLKSANDEINCLKQHLVKCKQKNDSYKESLNQKECDCKELCQQLKSCTEKLAVLSNNEKCAERLKTMLFDSEERLKEMEKQIEMEKSNSMKSFEKKCMMEKDLVSTLKQHEFKNSELQRELCLVKQRLNEIEADNIDLTTKLNLSNCLNEEYELQIDSLQTELNVIRSKRASSAFKQREIEDKLSSAQELTNQLEKQKDAFIEQIMGMEQKSLQEQNNCPVECESLGIFQSTTGIGEDSTIQLKDGSTEQNYKVDCSSYLNSQSTTKNPSDCTQGTELTATVLSVNISTKQKIVQKCQSVDSEQLNRSMDDEMENILKKEEEIIKEYENQIENLKKRLKCLELEKNISLSSNCFCYCSESLEKNLKARLLKDPTISDIENKISSLNTQLKEKDGIFKSYSFEMSELEKDADCGAIGKEINSTGKSMSGKTKCRQCSSYRNADSNPPSKERTFNCGSDKLNTLQMDTIELTDIDSDAQVSTPANPCDSLQNGKRLVKSCEDLLRDLDKES